MIKKIASIAALCAAIVLTGCGGAGSSAATASTTPGQTASSSVPRLPLASTIKATPAAVAGVHTYSIECFKGYDVKETVRYSSYEAAWEEPYAMCDVSDITGPPSDKEREALKAAQVADVYTDLDDLFAFCGRTDFSKFPNGFGAIEAKIFRAAMTLCPHHPKIDEINTAISAGDVAAAEEEAVKEDTRTGKFVTPGKYLVGTKMVPGQWQSQGVQVTDCYWEISDASGNIIENNFISIAPQFTLYVPASAAGFTATNCSFRWIEE